MSMAGISGEGLAFDFIQDAKPGNPDTDGISWLRTTDHTGFSYEEAGNRWLALGTPGTFFVSGPNNTASGDQNGRFHEIVQSTTKAWRPYHDLLVVASYISNTAACHTTHEIDWRDGTTVLWTDTWDGTNTFATNTQDVEIDAEMAINAFLDFGTNTPNPNRWQAGFWYKLLVAGD